MQAPGLKEKINRRFSGEHAGFWKFFAVALVAFALIVCFGRGNNLFHWVKAKTELSRQQKQKEQYLQEIAEMDRSIRMIRSNRDTLERIAREKLHYAAPGEDVYVIEK